MRKVEVRGTMVESGSTMHIGGYTYILDTTATTVDWALSVWIIRIREESGKEVTCRRVAGSQDEADKAASLWLNRLLRVNPGKLLSYAIERHIERF